MSERGCWCGYPTLFPYSADYHVCKACGTLVSRAPLATHDAVRDDGELYSRDYWTRRQAEHHALPEITERARLDLPERSTHWLRHLLERVPTPARILEVGCGHGGFLGLAAAAGYDVAGTEMSPWVVEQARRWFEVDVRAGLVERQGFEAASFDVVALHDVLEHLPNPLATLTYCRSLLKPGGVLFLQTPEYKEHLGYADLVAAGDLFLRHMDKNNDEHLFLFSRRSLGEFCARLGLPAVEWLPPVYSYDHYIVASETPLRVRTREEVAAALQGTRNQRIVLALLDKAHESADRGWEIVRRGGRA
ncbi:class I SAM-dependent methyltransferase [Nibricoccus sp. IMCC34717]|uniref:class I SAM-dependent methyltransferase n=1 Tax=Nibricoccus sp. IMCC34717 TaxID=3034021 RepID=UPI00384EE0E9